MEDTKKQPVEIFDVRGSFGLFQIAYLGSKEYYLYKTYSPWYGIWNIIPNVSFYRDAQRIDSHLAQKYAFRKDQEYYQKGRGIWVGSALILTVLSGMFSSYLDLILKSKVLILFVVVASIMFWITKALIQYKIATGKNQMLHNYLPNVKIKLYSAYWPGRLVTLLLFSLLFLPNVSIKVIMIAIVSYCAIPCLYNFFPDIKNLKITRNRIRVFGRVTLGLFESDYFDRRPINRSVPLVTLSFLNYWSNNQNIGKTVTHRMERKTQQLDKTKNVRGESGKFNEFH